MILMARFLWREYPDPLRPEYKPDNEIEQWFEVAISVFLIKGGVAFEYVIMYTYGTELFNNANIRGTANGICSFGGAILSESFVPIRKISAALSLNPMIGCAATSLITLPFILKMPETLNRQLK